MYFGESCSCVTLATNVNLLLQSYKIGMAIGEKDPLIQNGIEPSPFLKTKLKASQAGISKKYGFRDLVRSVIIIYISIIFIESIYVFIVRLACSILMQPGASYLVYLCRCWWRWCPDSASHWSASCMARRQQCSSSMVYVKYCMLSINWEYYTTSLVAFKMPFD